MRRRRKKRRGERKRMGREKGTGVKGERRRKMHGEENSITCQPKSFPTFEVLYVKVPGYSTVFECMALSLSFRYPSVLMISIMRINRRVPYFTGATHGKLFAKCTIYHLKTALADILFHL